MSFRVLHEEIHLEWWKSLYFQGSKYYGSFGKNTVYKTFLVFSGSFSISPKSGSKQYHSLCCFNLGLGDMPSSCLHLFYSTVQSFLDLVILGKMSISVQNKNIFPLLPLVHRKAHWSPHDSWNCEDKWALPLPSSSVTALCGSEVISLHAVRHEAPT